MATEVKHGKEPKFESVANMEEEFFCTIVGHYTKTDGLGAAGVEEYSYQSDRGAKRQNELLVLRSAFANWFVLQWCQCGGTRDEAVHHLSYNVSGL
jgi:hypothetical protein